MNKQQKLIKIINNNGFVFSFQSLEFVFGFIIAIFIVLYTKYPIIYWVYVILFLSGLFVSISFIVPPSKKFIFVLIGFVTGVIIYFAGLIFLNPLSSIS